jgi:arginine:pyruvate transaminase
MAWPPANDVRGYVELSSESNVPQPSLSPPYSGLTAKLSGRRSRAWDVTDRAVQMERDGRDIIHLGVGDPDFDTPQGVVDAAVAALRDGRTHYSPVVGEPHLRETIAAIGQTRYGVDLEPGNVTIFPGAQCALFATMLCLSSVGDEVIILEPFYATYEGVAHAGGADVVSVPLSPDDHFDLDVTRIAAAVTEKTRVILANSPGNPTGAVFSRSAWESLAEFCRENDIWLVSDEVYSEFAFAGEHYSPASVTTAREHVVVINSVSKSHAMTGWRLGWTIAPAELSAHLSNLAQCLLFGVSQFTQDAATLALRESQADVAAIKAELNSRCDLLCAALSQIGGLVVHKPAGGMFVLIDVSALGCDGEEFANRLLDHGGVAVVPGFAFGDSAANFVRIGYLVDEPRLAEAAERIAGFVASFDKNTVG